MNKSLLCLCILWHIYEIDKINVNGYMSNEDALLFLIMRLKAERVEWTWNQVFILLKMNLIVNPRLNTVISHTITCTMMNSAYNFCEYNKYTSAIIWNIFFAHKYEACSWTESKIRHYLKCCSRLNFHNWVGISLALQQ